MEIWSVVGETAEDHPCGEGLDGDVQWGEFMGEDG